MASKLERESDACGFDKRQRKKNMVALSGGTCMESKGIFQDIFAKMRLSGVCKASKNKISGFLTGRFSSAERDLHDTIPYMQESPGSM